MPDATFQYLLRLLTPMIAKQDTWMRKAITPEQRLIATLRFLATGRAFQDLKFSTGISPQALGYIIPDTCKAIISCLKNEYMKFPRTQEEWLDIAEDFEQLWHFPNCGGALDGKHIRITPPRGSGSFYFNYKGFHSIVLMALVNAHYEFIMVDIGSNGRVSDGGVLEQTVFLNKLKQKRLNLPHNGQTKKGYNFVFVADEAFALQEHVIKPFPQRDLNMSKKKYNYRLSRARRIVENAFGILANRFRVLHTAINLRIDKIDLVVYACCMLHNFLRRRHGLHYMPTNSVDHEDLQLGTIIPGEWRTQQAPLTELEPSAPRNASFSAKDNREQYMHYFNGEGAVPWQNRMVR
ncbi:putative nuclease HARBI1 [Hyperolius riggenbachi]|uniref:putative nuclease HARBI1 n=1 Tax=Hyperolius riggenbachi TaxID=752182 RepID=UPI0035A295CB